MSYPELLEWAEFAQIDPDPEWRADARSAQICAILANVNRDSKQRPAPYEIREFMMFDKLAEAQKSQAPKSEPTPEASQEVKGAKIAPETVAWLFAKSRQSAKQVRKP